MFARITSICASAITPTFIQYAKYIPEMVDGMNIVCGGINFLLQQLKFPFSLNKIVEFTATEKEMLANPIKLASQLAIASSKESALLQKTARCSIWLGGLMVGYMGLGQQLLCNLALIANGFISSEIYEVSANDVSFYWFALLSTVVLENAVFSKTVIAFVPFYAIVKFSVFYALLRYETLRQPVKKSTYDYLMSIKSDADIEMILRRAKQLVAEPHAKKA
jgi:hypothetical protein